VSSAQKDLILDENLVQRQQLEWHLAGTGATPKLRWMIAPVPAGNESSGDASAWTRTNALEQGTGEEVQQTTFRSVSRVLIVGQKHFGSVLRVWL
jgi:hypothetical protein